MFTLRWAEEAQATYDELKAQAAASLTSREKKRKTKSSKAEGLFKQVHKTIQLLANNPKHPGLQTHEYSALKHPYERGGKVFEAYAQQHTSGRYRVFWCYGPRKNTITILAITPHP